MGNNNESKTVKIILIIIIFVIIIAIMGLYKLVYFNGFYKAVSQIGLTKFTRDKNVTCTYDYSYKMNSKDYNDAIFYKTIKVKPNTPYKLTCKVKTEDVQSQDGKPNAGAQIAVFNSLENSKSILGTNDWQELEFVFDSKNRESMDIGFRLGGNGNKAKGTAWFSDFKLEEGVKDNKSDWNIACFIMEDLNVDIYDKNIDISMDLADIEKVKTNMGRFSTSIRELSENKMSVDYDIYEIDDAVKTITYNESYGYYLDPSDVQNLIQSYLEKEEYDYVFVAAKLGDNNISIESLGNDWIGLRRNGYKWNRIFKYKTS